MGLYAQSLKRYIVEKIYGFRDSPNTRRIDGYDNRRAFRPIVGEQITDGTNDDYA